jgi:3-deoxy-manno-octulosonate cytidylyltransferase (CMP-KDO synthetase)
VNRTGFQPQNSAIAIIPARFHSTRFPGKPLQDICGRPMIVRVCERAAQARNVSRVLVATDDERIRDAVRSAGFDAVMTRADHASGSDRLAEAVAALDEQFDLIVNVQGDEPLISPSTIERAVAALAEDTEAVVSTTCEPISETADVFSADVVMVVTDARGYALYFSRSPIPYLRDEAQRLGSLAAALDAAPALLSHFRKHTGLYVYRREFLSEFARLPQSELERLESLEQLRIIESGARIRVVEVEDSSIGVDTAEDLERVRAIYNSQRASLHH